MSPKDDPRPIFNEGINPFSTPVLMIAMFTIPMSRHKDNESKKPETKSPIDDFLY